MILMIANYDSFTFNLVQYFGALGEEIVAKRNDEISLEEITTMSPDYIVISPGPCTPNEAGISLEVVEHFAAHIPILGVCLGHQTIAQVFGGRIRQAKEPVHGKTSPIHHHQTEIFSQMPQPFKGTRYHSLLVDNESLPDCLEVTAWTEDDEIMGIRHKQYPVFGVQFHPESITTENGIEILKQFLTMKK